MYRTFGKRLLDVSVSMLALITLAPILASISLLLLFSQGRPVLFRQVRPGLNEKLFTMFKFRTMSSARDPKSGELLPDRDRLTRIGTWVRRTSLDELPELINVLRGEMSLVGPRPLLVEYLEHYSAEHSRRHEVRPGITGLAQVEGRQMLTFSERFARDVQYVDGLTLRMDLWILAQTVKQAFTGRGVISGQDVRVVDDLGMHPDSRAVQQPLSREQKP